MLVILDIDNTLSDCTHRLKYIDHTKKDYGDFLNPDVMVLDPPIPGAQEGVKYFQQIGWRVVFVTSRNEGLRPVTEKWIKQHFNIDVDGLNLLMRPSGDESPTSEIKRRILDKLVYKYDAPWIAVDDNLSMRDVYLDFNCIFLWSPLCWKTLNPQHNEPPIDAL